MKGRWEVCRIYEIALLTWAAPRSHCRICWIGESSGADPCCPWSRWHRRRQTLQKLSWNSRRRRLVKEEGRGRRREGSRMFSFLAFYFVGDLLALSEGSTILRHIQWPSENHYFWVNRWSILMLLDGGVNTFSCANTPFIGSRHFWSKRNNPICCILPLFKTVGHFARQWIEAKARDSHVLPLDFFFSDRLQPADTVEHWEERLEHLQEM